MADGEFLDDQMVTDLWGNDVYLVRRKKGRPPFEWTEENANKVSMLLAMGWNNDRIAGVVLDPRTGKAISVPTLKRYFRSELQARAVQRDRFNARRLMVTADRAFDGDMAAMRRLDQMVEMNDRMLAEERFGASKAKDEKPKEEALGKKAQAANEALDAEARLQEELELESGGGRLN